MIKFLIFYDLELFFCSDKYFNFDLITMRFKTSQFLCWDLTTGWLISQTNCNLVVQ